MVKDIQELANSVKKPIWVFGSILEKSIYEAGDIDLVMENPERHLKDLKKFSKTTGKMLDIFILPVMENEWNSKILVYPSSKVKRASVFCGKEFFAGAVLLTPQKGGQI